MFQIKWVCKHIPQKIVEAKRRKINEGQKNVVHGIDSKNNPDALFKKIYSPFSSSYPMTSFVLQVHHRFFDC